MNLRTLNITQLAEISGVSEKTIKKRIAGVKPFREDGRASWYEGRVVLPLILETSGVLEKKLLQENLRHEKAKADKVTLDVEKKRNLLVEIEKIAPMIEREYTAVKARLLSMPTRMAHILANITNPVDIKAKLEDAVNEVLTELIADAKFREHKLDEVIEHEEVLRDEASSDTTEDSKAKAEVKPS